MRRRDGAVNPARNPEPEDFLPLPNLPYSILVTLTEQPRHGWSIIRRMEELEGSTAVPSSGSLYLAIARLEERRLIEETDRATDDPRRRVYRLTSLGRRVVKLESARLAELIGAASRALRSLQKGQ
jgi:DNA-binding PadR family transcriptional regulator